ncbi:MAG: DUF2273 domain-containing protein [Acidibacillus sp.]|uniref:DUF2273 domain-containing protein n=1 Tax=Sulfoacidibacillus ferrooxidans TaxID=2005001 RepID=A0A9X2ABL8_9BACL|nr:DUF2273 domain-containing protein [Sulfoacidibacillus ferrooxidans]MCI0183143.1 hypothetical protein [Sulfoacidibacillus ferrooxidans]MCY0893148.1 DUF2273 domain-containing protein [Acidibacillus sp.]
MELILRFAHKVAALQKRYLGVIAGIVFWLLILIVGFFPTLLLAVFMVIGYSIGKFIDDRSNVQELVHRLWQTDRFD